MNNPNLRPMSRSRVGSGQFSREVIPANARTCEACGSLLPGPLGRHATALRDAMDWSQEYVNVTRHGPSVPTQSKIERGVAGVGQDALHRYATAYGVHYDDIRSYLEGGCTLEYFLLLINQEKRSR